MQANMQNPELKHFKALAIFQKSGYLGNVCNTVRAHKKSGAKLLQKQAEKT